MGEGGEEVEAEEEDDEGLEVEATKGGAVMPFFL